ncbi:MAG: nicotinamide-nucleotide amidohydrolase family protein [Nitrospirae bacterium]|uniref:CinA family protein n=1 Tax=Candidatus Magnetobacterium casense TaxID=1455061 RepID=UPI000696F5C7|nr:nicotinamide-nucleotide amidohydrolase family protein [Candidatus Magnetobacterium casensis]MBF0337286.1 nicotinamide-nucleotide amidohydrolase family protein [Nitrospirota bacterium]
MPKDDSTLADMVVQAASEKGKTIAVAESCTGGMVAASITSVAGSSAVFLGGVVSYSNELKELLLGVSHQTLATHGAVSPEAVLEMVVGLHERTHADVAVSISGIAGPSGGTAEKPVGLVYIAIRGCKGVERVREFRFKGNRQQVRVQSTAVALGLILQTLMEC